MILKVLFKLLSRCGATRLEIAQWHRLSAPSLDWRGSAEGAMRQAMCTVLQMLPCGGTRRHLFLYVPSRKLLFTFN